MEHLYALGFAAKLKALAESALGNYQAPRKLHKNELSHFTRSLFCRAAAEASQPQAGHIKADMHVER